MSQRRANRILCAALVFTAAAEAIFGQVNDSPTFEVASIKPSRPNERVIGLFTYPGGRITVSLYTLHMLIEAAYDAQPFQITGGPAWVRSDRFSIIARPPALSQSSKANPPYPKASPNAEQRQMLQSLLAERFRLKLHEQTREGSVYMLEKSGHEVRLRAAADQAAFPWAGVLDTGFNGIDISMPYLAIRLSRYFERPVIDRTGLPGSFDFRTDYGFADSNHPDEISAIVAGLRQLGLRLTPAKGPVRTIGIDSAAKPDEN